MLFAQQTITVVSNVKVTYSEKRGTYRWYRPVFSHEGSTLAADSADYNQGDNFFDAYGNVVITQPNGTVAYADKLHYIEDTQQAILTNKVRLVDKQATLSTDYLTYNMRSKIGTYKNGGQIISGTDTLISKNGYYFENSSDAYFRHDVIVKTPDVKIYTDTMRYNSISKMNYFYGPTTIEGKNGKLYTENGDYNTESDKARFGKNNLYTEGSKFLWGDSLLYDGKTGNGRAVKNVNFVDTAQHIVMRGHLGTYTKETQSTLVTQNAYIVLATKSDSTQHQTSPDSLILQDSVAMQDTGESSIDSVAKPPTQKTDSIYMSADTLFSQVIKLKDYSFANLKMAREGDEFEEGEDIDTSIGEPPAPTTMDTQPVKPDLTDSISQKETIEEIDSLKSRYPPPDSVAPYQPPQSLDSLKADDIQAPLLANTEVDSNAKSLPDSIGKAPRIGEVDSLMNKATQSALNKPPTDSLATDTAETRIVSAYHNVKIFKSDFQAIADSAYFGYPDSIIRCFGSPMAWSQGSQLSADTIYLQLKDEKIDNMLLENKAFVVSTELDSSKYHQVKGKRISGFFVNDSLDRVYVDGNAESIYYTVENNRFTGMARSLSSRIKVLFNDNKMSEVVSIRKAETTYYPIAKIPDDQEFLEGFIWKPELRPKSKEEVIERTTKTTMKASKEEREEKEKLIKETKTEEPKETSSSVNAGDDYPIEQNTKKSEDL